MSRNQKFVSFVILTILLVGYSSVRYGAQTGGLTLSGVAFGMWLSDYWPKEL